MFRYDPFFNKIRNTIIEKTSSLSNVNDKQNFRKECLALADYLVKNKSPPSYYSNQKKRWEGAIRDWNEKYYKGLTKHGGCFMIFEEEEKKILELIYEAEDFCEEKIKKKPEHSCIQKARDNPNNCDSKCSTEISEYNEWIIERKNYFTKTKKQIYEKCRKNNQVLPFPKKTCDVRKPETFKQIPVCNTQKPVTQEKSLQVPNEQQYSAKSQVLPIVESQKSTVPKNSEENLPLHHGSSTDIGTTLIAGDQYEHHAESQEPKLSESLDSGMQSQKSPDSLSTTVISEQTTTVDTNLQHSKGEISNPPRGTESPNSTLLVGTVPFQKSEKLEEINKNQIISQSQESPVIVPSSHAPIELPRTAGSINATYFYIYATNKLNNIFIYKTITGQEQNSSVINTPSILITVLLIMVFSIFIKYALIVMFKKKKKIKRKQMKFLRILLPSCSKRKRIFLTNDQLVQQKYNNKEITKKIKLQEHNIKQKVNSSKSKTERTKTIIEVHMEVLQEFRKEEWELKKREYLEICLDEFTKEKNTTYPNLKDDQLFVEYTKNTTGTEESITLCNKWIERHKNLSEQLKKEDWFNSLKNEWKIERDYIKRTKELDNSIPNDTQNISSLETEKNIWRQWISKKSRIIEHYLEYEWFSGLTEELQNTLDEYGNDKNKNNVSLINLDELEQKGSSEELYKNIKKKLLEKLCILVLMTILEECRKEENTENSESYLDNSINDCKLGKNIYGNSGITENINKDIGNVLEYMENKESYSNKVEEPFIQELNDWIREENTYINFINN
ncbi:STP1 protein [Plasmodium malariae]|uniref:STP1 protein n=1 Tax=Plasmodium malariae TaxID=5858 RepID=A0A1D3JH43_PLAMA|nr:STP1 protein [Plasmodium malariae]SBT85615.1 STP1 protein [Plasmodium malariae]